MFKSKPKIVFNCQPIFSNCSLLLCHLLNCSVHPFRFLPSCLSGYLSFNHTHTQTRRIPLSLYVRLHLLYHYFARVPSFHAAISSHSSSFSLSFCHFSFSPYIRSENTPLIKTLVYLVRLSATETCLFLVGEAHTWLLL